MKFNTRTFAGVAEVSLILALVGFSSCQSKTQNQYVGAVKGQSKIVGGAATMETDLESKSTVDLYFMTGQTDFAVQNFCSGTLVSKNLILSAAHCFADFAEMTGQTVEQVVSKSYVGFGLDVVKSLKSPKVKFIKIKSVNIPPEYKADSVATADTIPMKDVSLVMMDADAPAEYVPVELETDAAVVKKDLKVTLAGYGLTNGMFGIDAKYLMKVDVLVDNPQFSETQFTYTNATQGSCSGDSGGPAYILTADNHLKVIGVTSWGDAYCIQMGAYTSVPAMAPWLNETAMTLTGQYLFTPPEPALDFPTK